LVYLVPGDSRSGFAVIIPAAQEPVWLALPDLNTAGLAPFEAYITAASRSLVGPAAGNGPAASQPRTAQMRDLDSVDGGELDEVCDWAWRTAVGPLFDRGLQLPEGRPARIVLIPVRDLARVPWHAARRRTADGRAEYALQKAVFSYAPSARMMCESAWRGEVPLSDGGLVVADPATAGAAGDLTSARLEAVAVRETFYPAARYLGRLPDGSRSPEGGGGAAELRAWFDDPAGGPMVHLACHGVVRAGGGPGETSYLVLDGGSHLAAEEIADSLSAGSRDLGLAVLAACSSGATGRGYDEAFSLSTVFLAAGVRSVISAQWPVPDSATSVLMYLFHHCLRQEGLPPADALRAAQLWLLEGREPPAQMPEELRRRLLGQDLTGLTAWGAFVHSGR
jgi:CHAT domain-containing protein